MINRTTIADGTYPEHAEHDAGQRDLETAVQMLAYRYWLAAGDVIGKAATTAVVSYEPPKGQLCYGVHFYAEIDGISNGMGELNTVLSLGPRAIAVRWFESLSAVLDFMVDLITTVDPTMDRRNLEWESCYPYDEIDENRHAPCHPDWDCETTERFGNKAGARL